MVATHAQEFVKLHIKKRSDAQNPTILHCSARIIPSMVNTRNHLSTPQPVLPCNLLICQQSRTLHLKHSNGGVMTSLTHRVVVQICTSCTVALIALNTWTRCPGTAAQKLLECRESSFLCSGVPQPVMRLVHKNAFCPGSQSCSAGAMGLMPLQTTDKPLIGSFLWCSATGTVPDKCACSLKSPDNQLRAMPQAFPNKVNALMIRSHVMGFEDQQRL